MTEFDYLGEAKNMRDVYDNVMPKYGDRVEIPRPVTELCSKVLLPFSPSHVFSVFYAVRQGFYLYRKYLLWSTYPAFVLWTV
jgi:hypothetical protein